jgi:hypothetical protein
MSVLLAVLLAAAITLWEAFVLMVLWGWFIVPLGVKAVGMAHAIGLTLIASLLTHQAPSDLDDRDRISKSMRWSIAGPAIALVVGWVARMAGGGS